MADGAAQWRLWGALLGAGLGGVGAWTLAPRLATPQDLDTTHWKIISPGLREDLLTPQLGRGIHVAEGTLVMTEHAFFRPDMLVSETPRPVHRLELTLSPHSAPVSINIGTPPHARVILGVDHYRRPQDRTPATPAPSPHYALFHDEQGAVWLQSGDVAAPVRLSEPLPPDTVELSTTGPQSRLSRLRLLGPEQEVMFDADFSTQGAPLRRPAALVGALLGAGALALLATGPGGLVEGLLWLALVLGVTARSSAAWLSLAERLYLDQTPAWTLARLGVGLCLAALGVRALLATRLLDGGALPEAPPAPRWPWLVWGCAALLAAALGTHPPRNAPEVALALGGGALLLLPGGVAWRGALSPQRWLIRDLPALIGVAALGWGWGLLPLLLWRLLVVVASVRGLLHQAPGPAARYLLALLLLLPVGLEVGIRSTYLERAWDGSRLSQELASEQSWRQVSPSWKERCGAEGGEPPLRIAFLGGSSTGGAYQFGADAEAFFAAHAFHALCREAGRPGFEVSNYGTGDGNTFTISRTITPVLRQTEADVLLLYVGVNDIFTRHHTQTRAQREAILAAQQRPVRGLAALGRQIRLITGLSLLVKPLPDQEADTVSAVPLPDAEENHHIIARAAQEAGARVILMTELITSSMAAELADYDDMQRRVAAAHPHVSWVDVQQRLGIEQADGLLVDRNHLSREGNRLLGEALAPVILDVVDERPR